MSFDILRRYRPIQFAADRVSVSMYRSRDRDRMVFRSRICIALYPDVIAAMEWRERDRISIAVGTGDDIGKLRLGLGGNQVRVLRRPRKGTRRLHLMCAAWPGLPDLARATAVTWRRTDAAGGAAGDAAALEIDLPETWLPETLLPPALAPGTGCP